MVQAGLLKVRVKKGQDYLGPYPWQELAQEERKPPKHPQQVEWEKREQCPEKRLGESEGRDHCHNLKWGQGTRGICGDSRVVSLPESAWDRNLP